MKTNKNVIIGGIVVAIILIIAGTFIMNNLNNAPPVNEEGVSILFNAINNQYNIKDISLDIHKMRKFDNNTLENEEIIENNGLDYKIVTTFKGAEVDYYRVNDMYYICYDRIGLNKTCVDVSNSPTFTVQIQTTLNQVPTISNLQLSKKYFQTLFNSSAYNIVEISNQSINGFETQCIELSIDFKQLKNKEVSDMGMSTSNPLVLSSQDYTSKVCYDKDTGYPISSKINYVINDKEYTFENEVQSIELNAPQIKAPDINGTLDDMITMRTETTKYLLCSLIDDHDTCLKNEAFESNNAMFCEMISNDNTRKGCLYYLASYVADVDVCNEFTSNTVHYNDCLSKMANDNLYVEACYAMTNESIKTQCIENVTGTINQIGQLQLENAQCFTDEDCHVTGGLNQFCEKLDTINNGTYYLHIYDCLPPHKNYTSCVCQNNRCQWDFNDDYADCFNEMDKLDTNDYLQQITNEQKKYKEICGDGNINMTYGDAIDIAEASECVENSNLTDKFWCNNQTKTWWIDIDMQRIGCSPACVVKMETQTAEINYMCTGLN